MNPFTQKSRLNFFIMQIGKIVDIIPKNYLKNLPCANIRNCLDGCCDRTHFKNATKYWTGHRYFIHKTGVFCMLASKKNQFSSGIC